MTVATFDTLKFARNLRDKAKLSPEQAEGFADAISEAMQGDLATKADLRDVELSLKSDIRETELRLKSDIRETELRLKSDIRETELRLKADIESSKAELIKWAFGAIGFQTIIILGAVIALARVMVK